MAKNNEIQVVIQVATAKGKAEIKDFTNTADREFKGMKSSANEYIGAAGVAGVFAAAGGAVAMFVNRSIQKGAEFEQQLADLSAITGIAGDDLDALGDAAIENSVKTGVAARDQVEAYKLLASNIEIASIGGIEGLKALSQEVVTLSQAAGVDLALAANTAASTLNQFQLSGEDSARVVNLLAAGSKEGAAEVDDISESLAISGTSAHLANQSLETTVAALEILGQNALKGAKAGTGLRNMFTILQSSADKLAANGITDVNIKSDGLVATLEKLQPLLKDNAAMAEIFGRENINVASILIQNADAVENMQEKITGTNTAYEQASDQTDTYTGDMNKLNAAIDAVSVSLFQELKPALRESAQAATAAADGIAAIIQQQGILNGILNLGQHAMGGFIGQTAAYNAAIAQGTKAAKEHSAATEGQTASIEEQIKTQEDSIAALEKQIEKGGLSLMQEKKLQFAIDSHRRKLDELVQKQADAAAAGEKQNEANKDGQDAVIGYTKEIENNKAAIEKLINKKGELTDAEIKQLVELKQTNERLQGIIDKRKELASIPADPTAPIETPEDEVMQPDIEFGPSDPVIQQIKAQDVARMNSFQLQQELMAQRSLLRLADTESAKQKAEANIELLQAEMDIQQMLAYTYQNSVMSRIKSGEDLLNHVLNTTRQIIKAKVAEATAEQVLKVLSSVPFPANLIAAAAAGGAVSLLFEKAIPEFNQGGKISGPGTTTSDSILARLSDQEYVVNASSANAMPDVLHAANESPQVARTVNHLFKSTMSGYAEGGRVGSLPSGRYPSLQTIDRIVEISREDRSLEGFEMMAQKIEDQTRRLEQVERNINFRMSEFLDEKEKYELKEQEVGRG